MSKEYTIKEILTLAPGEYTLNIKEWGPRHKVIRSNGTGFCLINRHNIKTYYNESGKAYKQETI